MIDEHALLMESYLLPFGFFIFLATAFAAFMRGAILRERISYDAPPSDGDETLAAARRQRPECEPQTIPDPLPYELGREDERESWDRERRRRFLGRHQHKHCHRRRHKKGPSFFGRNIGVAGVC